MMESGFWGVILKPEKRYEQTVESAFHVTKACIEPASSKSDSATSVFVEVENDEFLICNLSGSILNVSLDLNFMEGEKICFRTSGGGTVHLTGYLIPEEAYDDTFEMSEAEEAEEEEEEDENEEEVPPQLINGKKGKKRKLEEEENSKKNKKKSPLDSLLEAKKKDVAKAKDRSPEEIKAAVEKAEKMKKKVKDAAIAIAKKPKLETKADSDDDDDDEDDDDDTSDDGIMDFTDNFAEEGDSEEDDDDDDDEEGDDDDDDDEDDEDDEDDDEEAEEEEEKVEKSPKKLNGAKTPNKKEESSPQKKKKENRTPNKNENKTPNKKEKNKTPNKDAKTPDAKKSPKRVIKGNIQVEDLKVGSGPEAKKGKFVGMYYEGRLKTNNKKFDSTLTGKPFKFRLGGGEVIKGWDLGLEGIKVGGKRRLIIPPGMAYGPQGAMPDIPPNSTLIFDVECKYVN